MHALHQPFTVFSHVDAPRCCMRTATVASGLERTTPTPTAPGPAAIPETSEIAGGMAAAAATASVR